LKITLEVITMTTIAQTSTSTSFRIPLWLSDAVLILVLGVAVAVLRATGLLAPDVTLPMQPYVLGVLISLTGSAR
jgi:hypothetical protein